MVTSAAIGNSSGDSQEGGDCPRRALPTRDIRDDSARFREFREDSLSLEDCSNMGIVSGACTATDCSGRG